MNAVDNAISARGFNGFETSNKLLVLTDGRSLYSTLSSGVFWDAQSVPRFWRISDDRATSPPTSASLSEVPEMAADFRRRGDHMVTKRLARPRSRRLLSAASRACRHGSGGICYLYRDIELEP